MPPTDLDLAISAHQGGRWQEAQPQYLRYLAAHPDDPVAGYNLGILLLGQGQLEGLAWLQPALLKGQGRLDQGAAAASAVQALLTHQFKDHADQFMQWLEQHGLQAHGHAQLRTQTALPAYLQTLAPALNTASPSTPSLKRYHPFESSNYVYAIDIVGGCNLRCPTCPVGQGAALSKGLMARSTFQAILQKAVRDQAPHRPDIWLFNWGEPLLHPELGAFIEDVRQAGLTSFASTNLHHGDRIDELMRAAPDRLKISLSSLRQSVYGQTHARGDIERVKGNLKRLAQARDAHRAATQIWIGHHLYRNTLEDQAAVQALATSLGFGYAPSVAIVAPIESALRALELPADTPHPPLGGLNDQMLHPPTAIASQMRARRSGAFDCELRFNMTSIQHDGQVTLCCGTTQALAAEPIEFLGHSHAALEQKKYEHPFCTTCMKNNLHLTTADLSLPAP